MSTKEEADGLLKLYDYFEQFYIGTYKYGRLQTPPRFDVVVWNCYERTRQGLPRTDNEAEVWHRAFQHFVDQSHPSTYRLIDQFGKEQNLMEKRLLLRAAGQPFSKRYPAEEKRNSELKKILDSFDAQKSTSTTYIFSYLNIIVFNFFLKSDIDRDELTSEELFN